MNKFSVTTLFLLLNSIIFAQNIIGLWQNQNNLKIYDYYTNTSIFDFSGDYNSLNAYGFYSDCTLPKHRQFKARKKRKTSLLL